MAHTEKDIAENRIAETLAQKGYRRTAGRIALLALLAKMGRPLAVAEIMAHWRGRSPDQATLYRALESLTEAGVVRRIDLGGNTARFEYTPDHPHHHHLVCTNCRVI
jgi:Fe2+ or Zn2+ uptake regulation protein